MMFIWRFTREISLRITSLKYRLLAFFYGYSIGRRCTFYGSVRFGSYAKGLNISNYCSIGHEVFFSISKNANIFLGKNVSINTGAHIVACSSISIGDGTAIGEYVTIRDQNHKFSGSATGIITNEYNTSSVTIGKNVWIGRGCFIGPGIVIGDGAVIGANSVVVKSIPANTIAVGSPAIPIKSIRESNGKD